MRPYRSLIPAAMVMTTLLYGCIPNHPPHTPQPELPPPPLPEVPPPGSGTVRL